MIEIIAIDKRDGERTGVSDWMYFFEEHLIRDINDDDNYKFEIIIDGVMVYPPNNAMQPTGATAAANGELSTGG
jgi:hypothetical protein